MSDDSGLRDPLLDQHLTALAGRTHTPQALRAAVHQAAEQPGLSRVRRECVPESGRRPVVFEAAWWLPRAVGLVMLTSLLVGLLRSVSLWAVMKTLTAGFPPAASQAMEGPIIFLAAGLILAGIAFLMRGGRGLGSRGMCF